VKNIIGFETRKVGGLDVHIYVVPYKKIALQSSSHEIVSLKYKYTQFSSACTLFSQYLM
jgi:hypothetical protein